MSGDDLDLITKDLDVEAKGAPLYRVGDVSRWFFAKSAHWLRWREEQGAFTDADGKVIGRRSDFKEARLYNLRDVERMIRVLFREGHISESQAALALQSIRIQAELYGMFDDADHVVDGVAYPYTVDEVAVLAHRSPTWVRSHAERLGGRKAQWDARVMQEFWRFPEDGLDERIFDITGEVHDDEGHGS